MPPTPDELADIKAHSMSETFTGWTPDQQSAYLAVLRGHVRPSDVASQLGWPTDRALAALESMYGHLLWDQSRPDAPISLRD